MGLDMYLYKKHYVKNWDWMADHEKHTISIKKGKKKLDHIKPDRVCSVVEEVMYWRKFNALHKWFVDNVQEGVDDCKESFVDESDLKMLLETLKYVKPNAFVIAGDIFNKRQILTVDSAVKAAKEAMKTKPIFGGGGGGGLAGAATSVSMLYYAQAMTPKVIKDRLANMFAKSPIQEK